MDDLDFWECERKRELRREHERLADQIAWLQDAGPDDWHRAALDFNWGNPLYLLDWIVKQDDCDVATALTIFWLGVPTCCIEETQERSEEPDGYSDLNRLICVYVSNRVAAGGYKRSRIAFMPDVSTKHEYMELVAAEKALARPNFRAHRRLITNRRGRAVINDAEFYDRYPEDFHCTVLIDLPPPDARTVALMAEVRAIGEKTRKLLPAWLRK
jgi:hypothetical protein